MSQRSIKEGNTNFHEGFSSSRNKIEALSASNWVPPLYLNTTAGKSIAFTIWAFVSIVISLSLLFNTLSRFVIAFFPRSKHLLISWLHSPFHWENDVYLLNSLIELLIMG